MSTGESRRPIHSVDHERPWAARCRHLRSTRRLDPVLSKYSNCLKSLVESDTAGHDNLGLDLERSRPPLRSCYFIADSVDLVHILVTEKSDPTTARNRRIRHSVRPAKAGLFSGSQTRWGKSQNPIA